MQRHGDRRGGAVARATCPTRSPRTSRATASATCSLRYAVEDEPLGTAGAIRFAADVAGIDERFVVCNGDVLTTLDLGELVAFHDARGAEATIHLVPGSPTRRRSVSCPTYDDGEVKAFVEKPPPGEAPTNWINAGTYVLEPSVLDAHPAATQRLDRARDVPADARRSRGRLYALQRDVYWLDIGTPEQVPARRTSTSCAARSGCRRWPTPRRSIRGSGCSRARSSTPRPGSCRRCSSGATPRSGPGAYLAATSVGARLHGRVRRARRGLGAARRRDDRPGGRGRRLHPRSRRGGRRGGAVRDEIVVRAASSGSDRP